MIFGREDRICVGFGMAALTRDGEVVWQESEDIEWEDMLTGEQAEDLASGDPGHDWRIALNAPFFGIIFQRQADGQWREIEHNDGFA